MDAISEKLKKFASPTPSKWREEAEWRRRNREQLKEAAAIRLKELKEIKERNK